MWSVDRRTWLCHRQLAFYALTLFVAVSILFLNPVIDSDFVFRQQASTPLWKEIAGGDIRVVDSDVLGTAAKAARKEPGGGPATRTEKDNEYKAPTRNKDDSNIIRINNKMTQQTAAAAAAKGTPPSNTSFQLPPNFAVKQKNEYQTLPLEFVHIPKTGGSSIEAAFASVGGQWGFCKFKDWKGSLETSQGAVACPNATSRLLKYNDYYSKICPTAIPWHMPPRCFDQLYEASDEETDEEEPTKKPPHMYQNASLFAVVRNPYDRLVSEYYFDNFAFYQKRKEPANPEHLNQWARNILKQNVELLTTPDPYKNMKSYGNRGGHWIPQYDFCFQPDGQQRVKHILKFEQLAEDFERIMKEYHLDGVKLPHVMTSTDAKGEGKKSSKLTKDALDDKTKQMLEILYSKDFEAFGYAKESIGNRSLADLWSKEVEKAIVWSSPRPSQSSEVSSVATKGGYKASPLEFVHIPKTGGTSIEAAFANIGQRWGICKFKNRTESLLDSHGAVACPDEGDHPLLVDDYMHKICTPAVVWHMPPVCFDQLNDWDRHMYQNATLFAVVRNPYDRMVSEYYFENFVYSNNKKQTGSAAHLNRWARKKLKLNVPFVTDPRAWKRWNYGHSMGHWIPQYDFCYNPGNGKQRVKHILRFENLENDFSQLMMQYNLTNVVLPHLMTSNSAKGDSKSPSTNTTSTKLTRHDFDDATKQMLEYVFKKDFETFGYAKESSGKLTQEELVKQLKAKGLDHERRDKLNK